jgi:hypothetical protein
MAETYKKTPLSLGVFFLGTVMLVNSCRGLSGKRMIYLLINYSLTAYLQLGHQIAAKHLVGTFLAE